MFSSASLQKAIINLFKNPQPNETKCLLLLYQNQMLNRFSCIALAGVATEYLLYGYAEGGLDDISKVRLKNLLILKKKYTQENANMIS